jgi:hypothetical protein
VADRSSYRHASNCPCRFYTDVGVAFALQPQASEPDPVLRSDFRNYWRSSGGRLLPLVLVAVLVAPPREMRGPRFQALGLSQLDDR